MNKKSIISIIGIVVIVFIGYLAMIRSGVSEETTTNTSTSVSNRIQVTATIPPVAMIASEILGDDTTVASMLSAGESPHTYEPSPQSIKVVSDSNVIFAIGNGLDTWITDIASAADNTPIIFVDKNITLLTYEEHEHDDEHENEAHEDESFDPHYWLNPNNVRMIAATMLDSIIELDPEYTAVYIANYESFIERLETAEMEWSKSLIPVAGTRIVTFHDGWAYFASYADVTIATTIEPFAGQQPTPQYIAALEDTLKSNTIEAVFTEPQLANDSIAAFIEDTGILYAILDPIGGVDGRDTYIDLMNYNISTLVDTISVL